MVKRSLFWGQAAGKLGEAVYYRAGGEQRTRTYVKNIKNPRSQAQAITRARLNNLTAVFRACPLFLRSFFKPAKPNQSAFNAFVSANSAANKFVANDRMVKFAQGTAMNMQVSNGSNGMNMNLSVAEMTPALEPDTPGWFIWTRPVYVPSLTFAESDKNTKTKNLNITDGKRLYQIFTAPENGFNLPAEFDLTLLIFEGGGDGMYAYTFTVHCSANSTDTLHIVEQNSQGSAVAQSANGYIQIGGVSVDTSSPTSTVAGNGTIGFGFAYESEAEVYCIPAVVVSYNTASGKVWNGATLGSTTLLAENYGTLAYDQPDGAAIVAEYTGVQTTI